MTGVDTMVQILRSVVCVLYLLMGVADTLILLLGQF